jgi:outer membrane protein insertion porin family
MFHPRGAFPAASIIALALWLPTTGAAQQRNAEDRPRVERIRFEGVEELDTRDLRRSIVTEETRCRSVLLRPFCWLTDWSVFVRKEYLDREQLAHDDLRLRVRAFQRGYRGAAVETAIRPRGRGVEVVFRIDEGPPTLVDTVHVELPERVLGSAQLRRARIPETNAPLDLIQLDSARMRLQQMLGERGYLDGVVRDTVALANPRTRAFVGLRIEPGPRSTLERIVVEGNERVEDRTIVDATVLREGRVLRRRDVESARRSLYESNLFHEASVNVGPDGDSAKTLTIEVREAPPRSAQVEVGFNTVEFVQVGGRFVHHNWLGGGRRLTLETTLGNLLAGQLNDRGIFRDVASGELAIEDESAFLRPTWVVGADLLQPAFRAAENTLGVGLFAHRRTVPAIAIDNGVGAHISFTRRMGFRSPTSVTYRFEATSVEAGELYFCVNFGVCDPPTIGALRQRHRLSPLGLSFISDHTDDPLMRSEGWRTRLELEHAAGYTASDFHYHRISGTAARYLSFGTPRRVLAGRVRFGWVRPLASTAAAVGVAIDGEEAALLLHPRKRFYAGGSNSVRGYGENQLGPRILTVSPAALMDDELDDPCTATQIAAGTCDPNVAPVDALVPRPLGGNAVLEGNIEYRLPVWRQLGAAVFVDAAVVRGTGDGLLGGGVAALTPGFGGRYLSPIGPIRVDLGIRPTIVEELPVITEHVDEDGIHHIVTLEIPRRYDPLEGRGGFLRQVFNRLALHISIGEAF